MCIRDRAHASCKYAQKIPYPERDRLSGTGDFLRFDRPAHKPARIEMCIRDRCAGVVLSVVGVVLSPQILRLMGTPENVMPNSVLYFRIYFAGALAVVLYNLGAAILQLSLIHI